MQNKKSQQSAPPAERAIRQRLSVRGELALAVLPTLTILLMLAFIEHFGRQRILFASLASSAFLIYLDPGHGTNRVRTLAISQIGAATLGVMAHAIFGDAYFGAGVAMVAIIVAMIALDAVHPPAVSTALAFAFRGENQSTLILFGFAVGIVAILVGLQRASVWLLARLMPRTA